MTELEKLKVMVDRFHKENLFRHNVVSSLVNGGKKKRHLLKVACKLYGLPYRKWEWWLGL